MNEKGVFVLRIAIGGVLLWFGISQFINPEYWFSYVPAWISFVKTAVLINATIDTLLGIVLLLGLWTRVIAFVAFLHMLGIALSLGYNDIAIRDVGLALAALSLSFLGAGPYALKHKK